MLDEKKLSDLIASKWKPDNSLRSVARSFER